MLKLPLLALFLRTIPEGVLLIFAGYILTGEKIDKGRVIRSGIMLGIITYLVRQLPINFGVHTMITLLAYIILVHKINKIDIIKAISVAIISFIIISFADWVTILSYIKLFQMDVEILLNQSFLSILLGTPSLLLMFGIMCLIGSIRKKRIR
ncbi:hypothetical protein HNQ80_001584 [Anaerosolibacter carboniphilus]|uniref:Uncharacterized protein n=1 Tax=Anaerosolibacter carboniphilus TaxID=1417629 RepID=A0A841KZD8_9FIRM|nr:hypothetical protein [Anaerosolibacter carboniphilus]MBB6215495.1 hypothetical protein [Anaerosolibacter carboniphilus]